MVEVPSNPKNNINSFLSGVFTRKILIYILLIILAIFGMVLSVKSEGPKLPLIPDLKMAEKDGGQVSGGEVSTGDNLQMSIAWPEVPGSMPVYSRKPLRVNDDYIALLMKKFGIVPVKQDGSRGYLAITGKNMEILNVDTYGFRFTAREAFENQGINLPDDKAAEKIAVAYLKSKGFLTGEPYKVTTDVAGTVGRYDPSTGRELITVTSKSVTLRRQLGNYEDTNSMLSVELGDNGKVISVHMLWPRAEAIAEYPIISPKEALRKLELGQTVSGQTLSGEVTQLYLAYMTHRDKDNPASDYIQPVYIFRTLEDAAVVTAIEDQYIDYKSGSEGQVPHVNRIKSIKQYGMPAPERIKELQQGKTKQTFTPEKPEFSLLVENIARILIESPEVKESWLTFDLENVNGQDPWSKARKSIESGRAFYVLFKERVNISTSFTPTDKAEKDKYGNHVVSTEHLILVETGPDMVELIYADGKTLYMKSIYGKVLGE